MVISIHNLPIADAVGRHEKTRFVAVRGEAGSVTVVDAHARYGNNIALGLNWNYNNPNWDVKLGYYPRMLETNLGYAPESATYDDLSENHLPFQAAYQNEKQNQLNTRVVRKFGNE